MSDKAKLVVLEKNYNEIIDTVLENCVKMLMERGLFNDSFQDIMKNRLNKNVSRGVYQIKTKEGIYFVKIYRQKVTSISKSTDIGDFLHKNMDNNTIIVVKEASKKVKQYLKKNHPKAELFMEHELMINLIDHVLVPTHELLSEKEAEELKEAYNLKNRMMSNMLSEDPVARYYRMKPGNICRILRPSETSGLFRTYRLVVPGSIN